MVGPTAAGLTVSVAADEVTELTELVTLTSYLVPDSATVVAGVVYDANVAPLIAVNDDAPGAALDH